MPPALRAENAPAHGHPAVLRVGETLGPRNVPAVCPRPYRRLHCLQRQASRQCGTATSSGWWVLSVGPPFSAYLRGLCPCKSIERSSHLSAPHNSSERLPSFTLSH